MTKLSLQISRFCGLSYFFDNNVSTSRRSLSLHEETHSSALPDETHPMQKLAARLVHLGMYVSLATIAISGIFVSVIYWIGIKDGLLIEGIIVVHELAVTTSYWLIACHVAAALFHRFKRDGV